MTVMENKAPGTLDAVTACSRIANGTGYSADGSTRTIAWALPEEVPIAVQINTQAFVVMMATPADLRDFASGLMISEGIVTSPAQIRGVLVMPVENGITVDIAIDEADLEASRLTKRSIEGRTGCGLCGVEDLSAAIKPLPRVQDRFTPSPEAVRRAAKALPGQQPMNLVNHSVHAAAWVSPDGSIAIVREDVGRHNALDKLIGAVYAAGIDVHGGFVLMTSRCSFELVQKCALSGIGALVTVSAPTALALDLARASGLYLAALGRDEPVVFNP